MSYQDDVLHELRRMADTLQRLEILLARTPKTKRPKARNQNGHAAMIAEARERDANQTPILRTRQLWLELCPANPQPIDFDLTRKQRIRAFWDQMKGEEGVRAVFELVANDDWLSGRPCGTPRNPRQRARPVHLFEAIEHALEIIERVYH